MTASEDATPGRTYAIPFDAVWKAALALADGGLGGWHLLEADDGRGVIRARRDAALLRRGMDVRIDVGLDENAQTRVGLEALPVEGRGDARLGRRTIAAFVARLDAVLGAEGSHIGDPSRAPTWSS